MRWLFRSRETTNYSYAITRQSRSYLASTIAVATGADLASVLQVMLEVENDETLQRHVIEQTGRSPWAYKSDRRCDVGRRIGWYAFVRILKPRLVVETGVDKGLGSCVLAAALLRNAAEGRPGRYLGTDINPSAGFLFSGPFATQGRIAYGDSIDTLLELTVPIDLFINDSDHSADYESREYEAIRDKLSPGAVILGDNSRTSDRLFRFAQTTGRSFLYAEEVPVNHWHPGDGIGVAFNPIRR